MMKATCGKVTDRGLNSRRTENQDNLLAWPERGLYLVADGVGGRRGGATASAMVVEVFQRVFSQELDGAMASSLGDLLEETIAYCNEKIYHHARQTPALEGMATTIAVVAIEGHRAIVAHVGDSRVYRFDTQGLIQLTEDHTDVNEAVRTGRLSKEEATHHPRRHVLNRALGADLNVEVERIEIELDEQSSLLLCTDGITIHLDEERLEQILQSRHHPQVICDQLREKCYEAGAEDNLTAILVDFGERYYDDLEGDEELVEEEEEGDSEEELRGVPFVVPPASRLAPMGHQNEEGESREEGLLGREPSPPPRPISRVFGVEHSPADDDSEEAETEIEEPEEPVAGGGLTTGWNWLLDRLPWRTYEASPDEPESFGDRGASPASGGGGSSLHWVFLLVAFGTGLALGAFLSGPVSDLMMAWNRSGTVYQEVGIDQLPKDGDVRTAYGRHLEGQTAEARQQLEAILTRMPAHAEANFYLGLIDYDEEKFEEAIRRLHYAARLDPSLPQIRIRLAMAYLSTGQMRTARDLLHQVVRPNPPRGGVRAPVPSPSPSNPAPAGLNRPVG
jgi:serine/threonine protein phosphatase PrpC